MATFGSDEQYLEDWLRFGPFHRARNCLAALPQLDSDDDGIATSAMVLIVQEWLSAHEDFGIWSDILKRHAEGGGSLNDCADVADLKWNAFFTALETVDGHGDAALFNLPLPEVANTRDRAQYAAALEAWAEAAKAAARNLNKETQLGKRLLYRFLNKIKHGLRLAPMRTRDGTRVVVFYPEAGAPIPQDLWIQDATRRSGERLTQEAFAVGRLLAATLDSYFALKFQRFPDVYWRQLLDATPAIEWPINRISGVVNIPLVPVYEAISEPESP